MTTSKQSAHLGTHIGAATIEQANGYHAKEAILPINTTQIKDLEVLDMNKTSTPQPSEKEEQQKKQQQQLEQQKHQDMLAQQQQQMAQQHHFQMQQQMMFQQQQPFHPMPYPQHSPLVGAMHMDPAILFQQNMPRDPAIISTQEPMYRNDKSPMNSNHSLMDPAIVYTTERSGQSPQQQQQQQQPKPQPVTNSMVQHMFQKQQQQQQQQPGLKSLDPSALFQQQQQQKVQPQKQKQQKKEAPSSQVPFQDPAIISVTSSPVASPKPKKPLFGGKKNVKPVKEIVVFEDYADFEKGSKGTVKKTNDKKAATSTDQSSSSNSSTPNIKKKATKSTATATTTNQNDTPKQQQQQQQLDNKLESLALSEKPASKGRSTSSPQIEVLTKQAKPSSPASSSSTTSSIPASLIPPRVRRNGSSNQQQQANKSVEHPHSVESNNANYHPAATRILTVSGGIQIPSINANQMEVAKLVGRETGLTQTQLVENGAFGISTMVLKAIGGHRRIQPDNHNAAPVVVILAGPTAIGESGIAAARHLANRGCQVIISMSEDTYCGATVEQYKKLAKFSGARIVYSLDGKLKKEQSAAV